MKKNITRLILYVTACLFFVLIFAPSNSQATQVGKTERLFVEPSYDKLQRRFVTARLVAVSHDTYFFIDEGWWNTLSANDKAEYEKVVVDLGREFRNHIMPVTRDIFGTMPLHSVTKDDRQLTVLFHPMKNGAGGYFSTGDQYSMYQYTRSNQRNIVYINTDYINTPLLKSYLAHEHMHVVTFNKKDNEQGVSEEVWLNELRSELVITLLGYNKEYRDSNLRSRVLTFLRHPSTPLTEWSESVADYGMVNLFGHYLVDHYGVDVVVDSLHSNKVGIASIEEALRGSGYRQSFGDIFTNFIKAIYFNDCSYGRYYCFKDSNLSGLTTYPSMIIMTDYNESVDVSLQFDSWSGGWYRVIGRDGLLSVSIDTEEDFTLPYVVCFNENSKDRCVVRQVDLNSNPNIVIEDFNTRYTTVVIMPVLAKEVSGPTTFNMKLTVIESEKESEGDRVLRERVQALAERLERLLDILEKEFGIMPRGERIHSNLQYGISNSDQVRVLQRFLEQQGEDIYPQGYITGNFYDLTKAGVIRLQERYWEKILAPLGLTKGTGFVGELTRQFINSRIR